MVSMDGEDRDGHVVVGILIVYHREPDRVREGVTNIYQYAHAHTYMHNTRKLCI